MMMPHLLELECGTRVQVYISDPPTWKDKALLAFLSRFTAKTLPQESIFRFWWAEQLASAHLTDDSPEEFARRLYERLQREQQGGA